MYFLDVPNAESLLALIDDVAAQWRTLRRLPPVTEKRRPLSDVLAEASAARESDEVRAHALAERIRQRLRERRDHA